MYNGELRMDNTDGSTFVMARPWIHLVVALFFFPID